MSNNIKPELSDETLSHYEDLIGRIGDDYIEYRWKRNPVSFSHYRHTQKAVEFAFKHIDVSSENLLEIGCGPGTWTDICLKNTRCMTIVDISSEMLKLAKKRFAGEQIDFHCGDFISSQINLTAIYNVIFSARALEYMDDKQAMVEKSAGLLLPGGWLVIITKNPTWRDKKQEPKDSSAEAIHSDWILHQDLEKIYGSIGLENVSTYPVCLGSYCAPFNNSLAIKFWDVLQERIYRKSISSTRYLFTESYMTIGRKPG